MPSPGSPHKGPRVAPANMVHPQDAVVERALHDAFQGRHLRFIQEFGNVGSHGLG
jgi:hypothetical protein